MLSTLGLRDRVQAAGWPRPAAASLTAYREPMAGDRRLISVRAARVALSTLALAACGTPGRRTAAAPATAASPAPTTAASPARTPAPPTPSPSTTTPSPSTTTPLATTAAPVPSPTSAPPPPGADGPAAGLTVTDANLAVVSRTGVGLAAGGLLETVFSAHGYHPGGAPAYPTVTLEGAGGVLAVVPAPPGAACPSSLRCAWVSAVGRGSGTVVVQGASGIVCSDPQGHGCVGIAAAIFPIQVRVS